MSFTGPAYGVLAWGSITTLAGMSSAPENRTSHNGTPQGSTAHGSTSQNSTPQYNVGIPQQEPLRQGLFYLAVGLSVLMLAMAILGLMIAGGVGGLGTMHSIIGYSTLLVAILAAVAAWRFSKATAQKGVFYHALSLPILMLLQIALGEMHQKHIHMALGIAILIAAVGLVMMTRKKIPASI